MHALPILWISVNLIDICTSEQKLLPLWSVIVVHCHSVAIVITPSLLIIPSLSTYTRIITPSLLIKAFISTNYIQNYSLCLRADRPTDRLQIRFKSMESSVFGKTTVYISRSVLCIAAARELACFLFNVKYHLDYSYTQYKIWY